MTNLIKSFITLCLLALSLQAMSLDWQTLNNEQRQILNTFETRWAKLSDKHQARLIKLTNNWDDFKQKNKNESKSVSNTGIASLKQNVKPKKRISKNLKNYHLKRRNSC